MTRSKLPELCCSLRYREYSDAEHQRVQLYARISQHIDWLHSLLLVSPHQTPPKEHQPNVTEFTCMHLIISPGA